MNSDDDKKLQALDLKIARALQIDVPPLVMPELPDIEQDNVSALPVRKRPSRVIWFAVAATIVLASSIALRLSNPFQTYDTLAEAVLAHLDHEPAALTVTDVAIPDRRLARAVPADVAVFDRDATLITYASPCIINGNSVPHLVVQGERGPVTILLMPDEPVGGMETIEGENVHGLIVPVGKGSIAIVGPRDEPLEPIQQNVIESVTWTT
jgi:hypothetical protein